MKIKLLIYKFLIALGCLGFIALSPAYAFAATLSLSPSSATYNKGCYGSIKVNVDTQGAQTEGTDAILHYDSNIFTQVTITNGTIYSDYPGSNVDTQNNKITLAGLASVTQPYAGAGTLATINFFIPNTATGASAMTFDFDPNDKAKTTDSNVIERGTIADVLSSVTNGSYTIGTGSCASSGGVGGGIGGPGLPGTGVGGTGGTPSATLAPGYLPGAGTQELTFMIAIVGSTLTVLGFIGFFVL